MSQRQCHQVRAKVLVDSKDHEATWDAMEVYFNCISACDLNDKECTVTCTRQLRDSN